MGLTVMKQPDATEEQLHVSQWQPYHQEKKEAPQSTGVLAPQSVGALNEEISAVEALKALANYMDRHGLEALHSSTQIIIAPGYRYHIVKAIVTNFHQPQSTLLLLVSAFVGGDWHTIYDYALGHDFRFLSYGDSSILFGE